MKWLASFFNLIAPGFGHVYMGFFKKGFLFFLLWQVLALIVGFFLVQTLAGALAGGLVQFGIFGYLIRDVFLHARRKDLPVKSKYQEKKYLIPLFLAFVAINILIAKSVPYKAYVMPSASMCPSVLIGDRIIVSRSETPVRGEIAIYRSPKNPAETFMKRIVGLPGDKITLKDNIVSINDVALNQGERKPNFDLRSGCGEKMNVDKLRLVNAQIDKTTFSFLIDDEHALSDFDEFIVPPDSVFVLGDNLNNSLDSRFIGAVKQSNLLGTAKYIYFSYSLGQFRWDRTGIPLQ